jgi:hypothetical protein
MATDHRDAQPPQAPPTRHSGRLRAPPAPIAAAPAEPSPLTPSTSRYRQRPHRRHTRQPRRRAGAHGETAAPRRTHRSRGPPPRRSRWRTTTCASARPGAAGPWAPVTGKLAEYRASDRPPFVRAQRRTPRRASAQERRFEGERSARQASRPNPRRAAEVADGALAEGQRAGAVRRSLRPLPSTDGRRPRQRASRGRPTVAGPTVPRCRAGRARRCRRRRSRTPRGGRRP